MDRSFYISWTAQKEAEFFEIESASSSTLFLKEKKEVIDFLSTSLQVSFGHSEKKIKDAIINQLEKLPIASPKALFELKENASKNLLDIIGLSSGKIFYTVSGAEAIENALKIARDIKKTKVIAARRNSYHGASLGALSVTGDWRNQGHQTVDDWTLRIPEPFDDIDAKETHRLIKENAGVAAICVETITGANGVIIPPDSWWRGIAKICKEENIFLILDEVICGFGRCGKNFGFQNFNERVPELKPDLICLSKGITGGYFPFGAVWTSDEIAKYYEENLLCCGLTNYAHPLGLAAMQAVIEILEDSSFKKHLNTVTDIFWRNIKKLESLEVVDSVRGVGMLAAIELSVSGSCTWRKFFDLGLHVLVKPNYLVLSPPLNISIEEIERGFRILNSVLATCQTRA